MPIVLPFRVGTVDCLDRWGIGGWVCLGFFIVTDRCGIRTKMMRKLRTNISYGNPIMSLNIDNEMDIVCSINHRRRRGWLMLLQFWKVAGWCFNVIGIDSVIMASINVLNSLPLHDCASCCGSTVVGVSDDDPVFFCFSVGIVQDHAWTIQIMIRISRDESMTLDYATQWINTPISQRE